MQALRKTHWKAPVVIVATYLSGLLFALAHHLFYNHLHDGIARDNRENGTSSLSEEWSIDGQKFNITVGTALAFLVRASLGAAISTAYAQVAWHLVKQRPTRLDTLDAIFDILVSPLTFYKALLWWKLPVLALLAIAFWLISLASIVTPGTLRIILTNTTRYSDEVVPIIDWTSIQFASVTPLVDQRGWAVDGVYDVLDPSYVVKQTFQTASLVGSIASLTAPGPNTAWSMDFPGPDLRCSDVSPSFEESIVTNAIDYMTTWRTCGQIWGYLGWQGGEEEPLPFLEDDLHRVRHSTAVTDDIYIAVFPNLIEAAMQDWSTIYAANCTGRDYYQNAMTERTIMRCQSFNASYHLDIAFTDGAQHIGIEIPTTHNRIGLVTNLSDPEPFRSPSSSQYNLTLVQNIAYQSVLGVFQRMLLGSIQAYGGTNHTVHQTNTSIRDTILRGSKELAPLQKHEDLSFHRWFDGKYDSVPNTEHSRADFGLASQIEELFHNVTVSLMTRPALQPNLSSPYAPPRTRVKSTTPQTVFTYSPSTLWLAYGLALGVSLLCALCGLFTILRFNSSFTTKFSTILRSTRVAELSTKIEADDFGGQDPLPKYLQVMTVEFRDSIEEESEKPRAKDLGMEDDEREDLK